MPSKDWSGRDVKQRASDVIDAIEAIRTFTKGLSQTRYLSDRKTQSAVERELLAISEACEKILDMDETVEERFPAVPWRNIRGIGNLIRHEYGRIDPVIIWNTISASDLDVLAETAKTF